MKTAQAIDKDVSMTLRVWAVVLVWMSHWKSLVVAVVVTVAPRLVSTERKLEA